MVATIEMDDTGVRRVRIVVDARSKDEALEFYKRISPGVSKLNRGIRGSNRVHYAEKQDISR